MKRNERFSIVSLLAVLAFCSGASSCDEKTLVNDWVSKVNPARAKVRTGMKVVPYQLQQQTDFKSYFGEIGTMAVRLTQDSDYAEGFNQGVAKSDLKVLCGKVFIERAEWETIVGNCTKNGFFLCSDEVKYYPDLVTALRKLLTPDLQRKFDSTPPCRNAL